MIKQLALVFTIVALFESTAVAEYTYSCWLNGWRKNANDRSADVFGVESNRYGFTLDVADFRKASFGPLRNPTRYETALAHKSDKLRALPPAQLVIALQLDGVRYQATTCRAGRERGVKRLSHVRLWESGRYVQHYDFVELDFRDSDGNQLDADATLDITAWPGSLTFRLSVTPKSTVNAAALELSLEGEAAQHREQWTVANWQAGDVEHVTLNCEVGPSATAASDAVAVIGADDQRYPVRFDETKHCLVASIRRPKRNFRSGYTDIRNYDEFKITVEASEAQTDLPFLLDLRPPANITGLCPILCDEQGRPTGIPVQLSKNWHYRPMGSYLMAYMMLPSTQTKTTYRLRIAYGFYGKLPSASHAQLSLLGYGGNGRWDQLAIGCWGETICFDMDMSLVDVAVTDIRGLMFRDGLEGKKWSWTNAGWGGDWLNLQDAEQAKFFWRDLKTAYLSHGPCLTNVLYRGNYGAHQEVDFAAEVQTLRTDDYARTFQRLRYTFTRDVSAKRVWLYKLGRTFDYQTPRIAYGNADGLLSEQDAPETAQVGQSLLDEVELAGPAPHWVAFVGGSETKNRSPKPNGYRALIIRNYEATLNGKTYTNPTLSAPVYRAAPTNLDLELRPPEGIREFKKGDRVELDLELITLPRVADDYYGPNEAFRKHLTENSNSWRTTYREAQGNDLTVSVQGGQLRRSYPIVVQAEQPEVAVTIRGGVGAVPIRFDGLKSATGFQLYRVTGGKRTLFDQAVHGHDFWQTDYDAESKSYARTYNLPLDAHDQSTWVLAP